MPLIGVMWLIEVDGDSGWDSREDTEEVNAEPRDDVLRFESPFTC